MMRLFCGGLFRVVAGRETDVRFHRGCWQTCVAPTSVATLWLGMPWWVRADLVRRRFRQDVGEGAGHVTPPVWVLFLYISLTFYRKISSQWFGFDLSHVPWLLTAGSFVVFLFALFLLFLLTFVKIGPFDFACCLTVADRYWSTIKSASLLRRVPIEYNSRLSPAPPRTT